MACYENYQYINLSLGEQQLSKDQTYWQFHQLNTVSNLKVHIRVVIRENNNKIKAHED